MARRGSSQLLIQEPPLQVLPSLAVLIGLNEAIFLQQLHYWLLKSDHYHDHRYWIYNTYEEWHNQLPFWSVRTIRRIVGSLEERSLIVSTTKYNRQKVDQTKWYTLVYEELNRLTERADQVDKLATWAGQDEQLQVAKVAASVTENTQQTNAEKNGQTVFKTPEELAAWEEEQRRLRQTIRALEGFSRG